jgi:hypothetical protein
MPVVMLAATKVNRGIDVLRRSPPRWRHEERLLIVRVVDVEISDAII